MRCSNQTLSFFLQFTSRVSFAESLLSLRVPPSVVILLSTIPRACYSPLLQYISGIVHEVVFPANLVFFLLFFDSCTQCEILSAALHILHIGETCDFSILALMYIRAQRLVLRCSNQTLGFFLEFSSTQPFDKSCYSPLLQYISGIGHEVVFPANTAGLLLLLIIIISIIIIIIIIIIILP